MAGSLLLESACHSRPFRAYEGARAFSAGTEALERGDSARSVVLLEHAAALVPDASEIQNRLGLAYWAEGQVESARSAFEQALVLDCDNVAAQLNLDRLEAMHGLAAGHEGHGGDHGG